MNKIKVILVFVITLLCSISAVFAGNRPEAHFGIYGIKHQSGIAEYQQYVGQIVKYLPARGVKGNATYDDNKYFIEKGGRFDKEYIITKISGNDKRMTFHLQERNGKSKVKMVVNNQHEYYSYGKYAYCITENYSIPLFLIEKYRADKDKFVGQKYPKSSSTVETEVIDIVLKESEKSDGYPEASLVLRDNKTGKTYNTTPGVDLSLIGMEFTNSKYKCKYNLIGFSDRKYVVKNSIDGKTKEIWSISDEASSAFYGDDRGSFVATLTQVEKPSNSDVRYGNTTTVTDKDITKFSYVDNFIDILIFASDSQFSFILKNVSDNTIKLVWDEAVFVDVDGSTSKIMHSGIKYSQREAAQPASTIIKGAKIEDIAVPTDKVYYSDVLKDWKTNSLFSTAGKKVENQTVKLMLPIQVKDVVNEYIFDFDVKYVYDHPEYLAD